MSHSALSATPGNGSAEELEAWRLEALNGLDLLDTPPEEAFDRIARLIRNIFDLPIGIVSVIDAHRQWIKAGSGSTRSEIERRESLCNLTIQSGGPHIVSDLRADPQTRDNPLVTGPRGLRFYAGVPLTTSDGFNIGTLCAIGHEAREFGQREIDILADLARVTMDEIELKQRASTDNLTGLMTRGTFREEAERALGLAVRHKQELAVVTLDIDHFKAINDTYGHGVGDRVLKVVAQTCASTPRQTDLVGRIGGEEFVVLLPHTGRPGALEAAERIREAIEMLALDGTGVTGLKVTASFGIATLDGATGDLDALLANADAALYEAKAAGRNCCVAWRKPADSARRRVLKAGRIIFNNRSSTIDCTVRSIGETGAGLDIISASGVPERFRLAIRSDNFETECRVVAQTERHLEVEFA